MTARFKWKISLEIEGTDGCEDSGRTKFEIDGSWKDSKGLRPFLECFCLDVGRSVGSLVEGGHILTNGDGAEALLEGYKGPE